MTDNITMANMANHYKPENTTKEHNHCGTPECCGKCESGIVQKQTDYQAMDEEFAKHCLAFFKGESA